MSESVSYPRVYRATWRTRAFGIAPGLFLVAGAPAIFWRNGLPDAGKPGALAIGIGITAVAIALGLWILWLSIRTRIVLHADAIEVFEPPSRRRAARADFEYHTWVRGPKGGRKLALVPRDETAPMLTLPFIPRVDKTFASWMAPIANRPYDPNRRNRKR